MKALFNRGLSLYKNQYLLSRSAIVITAALFSNGLAYLFQLLSGRYFSTTEYGIIYALFSLTSILPLALIFFTNGIPKLVAEIKDIDYPNRISALFFTIFKLNIIIVSIMFLLMVGFRNQIASYLQIDDTRIIIVFALSTLLGIMLYEILPFLQGLMRFKAHSFLTICQALGKISAILFVMYFGLSVTGLYVGLSAAAITVGAIAIIIIKKNLNNKFLSVDWIDFKILLKYSLSAAFAIIGINLLQSMDAIQVKHHFTPVIAGTFASVSVIGKIIFYAASPIAIVMLPICAQKYKQGKNYYRTFLVSISLALLISSSIALIYIFFPGFVTQLLFGNKHLGAVVYLPFYAIYMIIYTLMFLITQFFIAVSRFVFAAFTLIGAAIQFIGLQIYNDNLNDVIWVNITAVSVVVILFIITLTIPSKYRINLKGD